MQKSYRVLRGFAARGKDGSKTYFSRGNEATVGEVLSAETISAQVKLGNLSESQSAEASSTTAGNTSKRRAGTETSE